MDKNAITVKEEILDYEEDSFESEGINAVYIKEEVQDDAIDKDAITVKEEILYYLIKYFFFHFYCVFVHSIILNFFFNKKIYMYKIPNIFL